MNTSNPRPEAPASEADIGRAHTGYLNFEGAAARSAALARPEAPDAGSALLPAFATLTPELQAFGLLEEAIGFSRENGMPWVTPRLSTEQAAALLAAISRAPAVQPPARAAAVGDGAPGFGTDLEAAIGLLRTAEHSAGNWSEDPQDDGSADQEAAAMDTNLRRAIADHTDAAVAAALSASHAAPSVGAVTLEEMAERADFAIEGEFDGLAATKAQATDVVAFILTGLPPGPERDAALAAILVRLSDRAPPQGQPVRIAYVNWRGEATTPTIVPTRVFWGSNEWHPEPCWLLEALDVGKGALRTFDIRKIRALDAASSAPSTAFRAVTISDGPEQKRSGGEVGLREMTSDAIGEDEEAWARLLCNEDGINPDIYAPVSELPWWHTFRRTARACMAFAAERAALASAEADGGWLSAMTPPYDQEVEVRVGAMRFRAKLMQDASINENEKSCDQWQATREGEHPPCWTDGACWESNEDLSPSLQPDAWRFVPPAPASAAGEASRG